MTAALPIQPEPNINVEKWQQLVSACAGGVIALFSAWLVQRHLRANARRELLRLKVEEVYRLSLSLDRWNSDCSAHLVQATLKLQTPLVKDTIAKCPIDEIAMLASLYIPAAHSELKRLEELELTLQQGIYDFSMNVVNDNPVHPVKAFDQMLAAREKEVRVQNEQFRNALKAEMKRLLD